MTKKLKQLTDSDKLQYEQDSALLAFIESYITLVSVSDVSDKDKEELTSTLEGFTALRLVALAAIEELYYE